MIRAEKICKSYGDLNVLDNLDLHVKSGQFSELQPYKQ